MRMVRSVVAGVFVALSGLSTGPAVGADDAGEAALRARIDAALADAATPRRARARYEALRAVFARPDRPGLRDDFARFQRVARELRRTLAADETLRAALADAVAEGLGGLDAADAAVVVLASDIEAEAARRRVEAQMRSSRRLTIQATVQRALGRTGRACESAGRAAMALVRAESLAERTLARQDAASPTWKVALAGLDGALLSVHVADDGPSPVYVVGADDGRGPTFLRGGPEGFVRVPVAGAGDLWWVDGVPGGGVWTCGSAGLVAQYDETTGAALDRSVAAQTGILYGVWGSGPADVWTVGEDADGEGPASAAFRWDGETWSPVALPPEAAGLTLYKVWGAAADDVWACGRSGLLLHFDGDEWSAVPSGTDSSLLTVHGTAPAIAVGLAPVVTERGEDGTWSEVMLPPMTERLNGVRAGAAGDAWAVGYFRTVLRRTPRGWAKIDDLPATSARDFHAVTIDPSGGVWLAGGVLTTRTAGALLYLGSRRVSSTILPQARLASRVAPILTASCAVTACHAPPFLSEGLDLATEAGLRDRVAGVASHQSPFPLVAPGRPSASYLFRKVAGTHLDAAGSGDRMPMGEPPLADEDLDAIRAWILEGATR